MLYSISMDDAPTALLAKPHLADPSSKHVGVRLVPRSFSSLASVTRRMGSWPGRLHKAKTGGICGVKKVSGRGPDFDAPINCIH